VLNEVHVLNVKNSEYKHAHWNIQNQTISINKKKTADMRTDLVVLLYMIEHEYGNQSIPLYIL